MIYTQEDYNNLVELLLFYDLEDTQEIDKILNSSNFKHLRTNVLNAIKSIDNKIDFYFELKNTKLFTMPKNSLEYKEILANEYAHKILVADEYAITIN